VYAPNIPINKNTLRLTDKGTVSVFEHSIEYFMKREPECLGLKVNFRKESSGYSMAYPDDSDSDARLEFK